MMKITSMELNELARLLGFVTFKVGRDLSSIICCIPHYNITHWALWCVSSTMVIVVDVDVIPSISLIFGHIRHWLDEFEEAHNLKSF